MVVMKLIIKLKVQLTYTFKAARIACISKLKQLNFYSVGDYGKHTKNVSMMAYFVKDNASIKLKMIKIPFISKFKFYYIFSPIVCSHLH